MSYRLELAATAKADIRETTRWLQNQKSRAVADRWLAGLQRTMNSLTTHPRRCPRRRVVGIGWYEGGEPSPRIHESHDFVP